MNLRKLTLSFAAAMAAITLLAGPVAATEDAPAPTTEEAPAEDGHDTPTKRPFPIDFEDPQGLFGAILLGIGGLAAALAGANLMKQLRGERPTASGEWRPR
ncbi:MAG: hypothetical protein ACRDUY_16600 [Nitriliruptorales bacterium]